jgi:AlwI restriction endonuclease.
MIPEIDLLIRLYSNKKWDSNVQTEFINNLANSDFFEGYGSMKHKAFSARDRITRAPKALGFVDLKPFIQLTDAGKEFVYGKRSQEVFLRQLLKFQLPSPYHIEKHKIQGTFYIKPYLEIMRLIRELEYLTFDEVKIFAVQLTDYRLFEKIKNEILAFRSDIEKRKENYKMLVEKYWDNTIQQIFKEDIFEENVLKKQTKKGFKQTKKSTIRDYADACFRYLRYTGLISISHREHSITFVKEKIQDVDFILNTVDRNPKYTDDIQAYKNYLFNAKIPTLYIDHKENIIDSVMRVSDFTRKDLSAKTIDEIKDLRDEIIKSKQSVYIKEQVIKLKSYALYSEIIDTYNEIISDELYDSRLILEWNTWRAMTMLNGGNIKGNFRVDDEGQPMLTAPGNLPDIECDYGDFQLSVEVSEKTGKHQYESEVNSILRHYNEFKNRTGKNTYCLFLATSINRAILESFYIMTKSEVTDYLGMPKIIPLELDQFMRLIENSYNYKDQPSSHHVSSFLDMITEAAKTTCNETEWFETIYLYIDEWLSTN